jgi:flagellin-specific chaperone FliS
MGIYKKDYKLKKAIKIIEGLDNSPDNELIKYYISKQKDRIATKNKELKEYSDFFKTLKKLLPKNISVLG